MFKRIRQMRISLAAKCQLLFGAAVVLIIAAALFVPWQRMEQLTEQLNERSARTLTDYAVEAHAARYVATTQPFISPVAVGIPTTLPVTKERPMIPPRLILTGGGRDENSLTPFERRAAHRLLDRRERDTVAQLYETEAGVRAYRFARVESSCIKCHTESRA